jgi:hypothetical protein
MEFFKLILCKEPNTSNLALERISEQLGMMNRQRLETEVLQQATQRSARLTVSLKR